MVETCINVDEIRKSPALDGLVRSSGCIVGTATFFLHSGEIVAVQL